LCIECSSVTEGHRDKSSRMAQYHNIVTTELTYFITLLYVTFLTISDGGVRRSSSSEVTDSDNEDDAENEEPQDKGTQLPVTLNLLFQALVHRMFLCYRRAPR